MSTEQKLREALEWISLNGPDDAWDLREAARQALATTTPPAAAPAPAVPQGEPWYGHKFKEVTRGVWCCECGKTITEGVPPCMNGTLNISTTQHDAVSMDATQMPDAGSAGLVVQGEFTRADGSRSSLRGSGTKHDPFVADNLDDLAAAPSQPVTLTDEDIDNLARKHAGDPSSSGAWGSTYEFEPSELRAFVNEIAALRGKEQAK